LFCLALAMAGCGPSGDDPLSRLDVVSPPGNEYRLRFLSPPWYLVRGDGTTTALRIDSNRNVFGGIEGGAGKYELVATVEPGTPASRAAEEASQAVLRGEIVQSGPREVTNDDGDAGQEVLTSTVLPEERHYRYVYFPLDPARVVRLAFSATPNLESAEADAMIAAIEIGPE
jgi:hypothetical protein